MKKWGIVALGIAVLGGCALFFLVPRKGEGRKAIVMVPADPWEASQLLRDQGILGNPYAFFLLVKKRGQPLVSGEYRFEGDEGYGQILHKLVKGDVVRYKVTFPEGFSAEQIGKRLARYGLVREEEFLEAVQSPPFDLSSFPDVPQKGSLEGFLFPETYFFTKRDSLADIITRFLREFERALPQEAEKIAKRAGLTIKEIVTIASLVEKEVVKDRERALVAGVIYNRLRKGMKLEVDATVQYALGAHQRRLLYRHLEVNSPYNTYLYKGLPPGPICNPGEKSLKAAFYPAHHAYYYYVAKKDGSHYFSRTFEEHKRYKRLARGNSS